MSSPHQFSITSWNVEGLCGDVRSRIVSRWVGEHGQPPDFLCLQEIKVEGFWLDKALGLILPNHGAFMSLPVLGNGGTTILVHPRLEIVDSGSFLEGQVVSVIVKWQGITFGIMNLYDPNSQRKRKELWFQIQSKALRIDWILTGDFNMTKSRLDSSGPSPLIRGSELIEWRLLVSRFCFLDTLELLGKVDGSRFTRRRRHGPRLDQSRIDRIYFSGLGWWPHQIISLKHI